MLSIRTGVISAAVAAAMALASFTPANASPRGDRAFLGAVAGVFGAVATIAAANAARDRYYDGGYYDDGPGYAAPVYGPAYGPAHRPGFHRWHHRHGHR
jgi:hypothetical protein